MAAKVSLLAVVAMALSSQKLVHRHVQGRHPQNVQELSLQIAEESSTGDSMVEFDKKLGTTLFCFMAVLPDSYEVHLLAAAMARKTSIFACENHRYYSSVKVGFFQANGDGGVFNNYSANSGVFVDIWNRVFQEELYKMYDWTVKVDPDTVWLPSRLRPRLAAFKAGAKDAVYIRNTEYKIEILGPIEVISFEGMVWLSRAHCAPVLEGETFGGEDDWLHKCVRSLNMTALEDLTMLINRAPVAALDACEHNQTYVAYHAFKDPSMWAMCADLLEQ